MLVGAAQFEHLSAPPLTDAADEEDDADGAMQALQALSLLAAEYGAPQLLHHAQPLGASLRAQLAVLAASSTGRSGVAAASAAERSARLAALSAAVRAMAAVCAAPATEAAAAAAARPPLLELALSPLVELCVSPPPAGPSASDASELLCAAAAGSAAAGALCLRLCLPPLLAAATAEEEAGAAAGGGGGGRRRAAQADALSVLLALLRSVGRPGGQADAAAAEAAAHAASLVEGASRLLGREAATWREARTADGDGDARPPLGPAAAELLCLGLGLAAGRLEPSLEPSPAAGPVRLLATAIVDAAHAASPAGPQLTAPDGARAPPSAAAAVAGAVAELCAASRTAPPGSSSERLLAAVRGELLAPLLDALHAASTAGLEGGASSSPLAPRRSCRVATSPLSLTRTLHRAR